MLIELRDVEVHVEPEEILTKALQEGDLSLDQVVRTCIYEESAAAVLDALDHGDIEDYCKRHDITTAQMDLDLVAKALKSWSQTDKAKLLWLLLKCEG